MAQEQTAAAQAVETTQETVEQKQAREAAEAQAKIENKFARFMNKGTETPAEIAGEMQTEAVEQTAEVVDESGELTAKAREAGADEIAQKAEGLGGEANAAKEELGSKVKPETTQEAQPATEELDTLAQFYQKNPNMTEAQRQAWADIFTNNRELDKGEHLTVGPLDLKVGDIFITKEKGTLPDYYLRIISINLNEGVDNPNRDSVDIMTEYTGGRGGQVGMDFPKNSAQFEIVRPASEPAQEAPSTPEQAQEDVFKKIVRERAEARGELAEKQQKPTSQILEEIKGQTVENLKQSLNIRNDYLVDQINIYQEYITNAESQGFKREAEKAQLQDMQKEQEENAAKSRELLTHQSYEIYE